MNENKAMLENEEKRKVAELKFLTKRKAFNSINFSLSFFRFLSSFIIFSLSIIFIILIYFSLWSINDANIIF